MDKRAVFTCQRCGWTLCKVREFFSVVPDSGVCSQNIVSIFEIILSPGCECGKFHFIYGSTMYLVLNIACVSLACQDTIASPGGAPEAF